MIAASIKGCQGRVIFISYMLADLLLEFGAVEAINLDGGGSTTMVVLAKLVNHLSEQTGERPVSDAILVFSKAN